MAKRKHKKFKWTTAVTKEFVIEKNGKERVVARTPIEVNQGEPLLLPDIRPATVSQEYVDYNPPDEPQPNKSQYQKRKEESNTNWAAITDSLHKVYVINQGPPSLELCPNCGEDIQDGEHRIIRCDDCLSFMCTACAEQIHTNLPLHSPKMWDDTGLGIPFTYKRVLRKHPHFCTGHLLECDMDVIDERGKCFQCSVESCTCSSLPYDLVALGYWPSSPKKPTRAYHQGFLLMLTYLMLEGHMSLYTSCQSIRWKNGWTSEMTDSIYRQLTNEECFEQFRHFYHRNRTLDGTYMEDECPACPKSGGTRFIALDANFGLVRKQNAGTSVEGAKHGNKLFIDDEEVSSFVNTYQTDSGKEKEHSDCNQFQAGDSVRSKNKALRLDKTGVFGSACRHDFPCKFLNMEHGERYAYPVMMLKKLVEDKQDTSLVVSYDISCKLNAHLQKTNQTDILGNAKLVLPCWHAYGHNGSCQVSYSTRWVDGCGLVDGENMERIWSYARPFSHITKEMTPSHRIDLLTDALLHFSRRKYMNIVDAVKAREEKAQLMHQQAVHQLKDILEGNYSMDDVAGWKEDEKNRLKKTRSKTKMSWKEEYVSKLQIYQHMREQLAVTEDEISVLTISQHCESLEKELRAHEKKNKIERRWMEGSREYVDALAALELLQKSALLKKLKYDVAEYHFVLETQKKYSDGQAIATKIKAQVEKTSRYINNTINRYNSNNFQTNFGLPRQITRKDAVNVEHEMYHVLDEPDSSVNLVNPSLQRRAVGIYNIAKRAEEELQLIDSEKEDVVKHFRTCLEKLRNEVSKMDTNSSIYANGLHSLMLEKINEYTDMEREARQTFFSNLNM